MARRQKEMDEKLILAEKFTNQHVLLCGNGINQLENNDADWADLLQIIVNQEGVPVMVNNNKSYPLIFEEIVFNCDGSYYDDLKRLKQRVYGHIIPFTSSEYHNRIINCRFSEILTTNYDYSFERTEIDTFHGEQIDPIVVREYKYSLYRKHTINDKLIWHIHGELNNRIQGATRYLEESILIGNEHYGDYQRKVHEYIKPPGGLSNGLTNPKESWVTRFFTHNVHIAGLGLDYTETHLWWLLNFRARKIKEHGQIPNTIKFYFPSFSENGYIHKKQLMEALGVETVRIEVNNYTDEDKYQIFWDQLINRFNDKL